MTSDKVTFEHRLKEKVAECRGGGWNAPGRGAANRLLQGCVLAHGGSVPLGTGRPFAGAQGAGQRGGQGHRRGNRISRASPAIARTLLFTPSEMGSPRGLLSGDVIGHMC